MKIVLYSGGQLRSNHHLHGAVARLALSGRCGTRPLSLTYIPFCAEDSKIFFERAKRRYRPHGVEKFQCLSVDDDPSAAAIDLALQSDIIYLAGGNTFYFLKHLRKSGVLPQLKAFSDRGGVLAGLSAGGLILSPTVKLAADPGLGPDDNEVNMKNFKGLGLFPFEFSPHYEKTPKMIKAHRAYSLTTDYPVYAVEDGAGIIIDGNEITVRGKATLYCRGNQLILDKLR